MNSTTIYLSGGTRTDWRETVKEESPVGMVFNEPLIVDNGEQRPPLSQYSTRNQLNIKKSDVVFAYLEADNPSGFGVMLECAYAKGLGKTVILVMEENHHHDRRYMAYIESFTDITFNNFDKGVEYLTTLN